VNENDYLHYYHENVYVFLKCYHENENDYLHYYHENVNDFCLYHENDFYLYHVNVNDFYPYHENVYVLSYHLHLNALFHHENVHAHHYDHDHVQNEHDPNKSLINLLHKTLSFQ
jgi:hypothetical protein